MPTIAELQINVDSRPVKEGTAALLDFANAADKAAAAGKKTQDSNVNSAGAADKAARSEEKLSEMIDAQAKKLENLAEKRRKLESSNMKDTRPDEYARLNRIIDANIALVNRQGGAVDQLNAKQQRDVERRARQVEAELRAQERLAEATVRQENIVSNAAARQQRQIENTINGLDRQVKAQNEYNKTMEELNRTRALSGMSGPGDIRPQLSGGEYETFTKQAKAQRDAQLAVADTSREMERAKNKLDSYEATLGKVERAEIQYARAVRELDNNLKLGNITLDQYDQKLAAFAAKRDASVAAANDNSAAESRFERQLRGVVGAFDPVIRAQDDYNNAVKILKQGLDSGVISMAQYDKALREQEQALEGVKQAQSGMGDMSSQYENALNRLVPFRAELKQLEEQEKALKSQMEAGRITTAQQISDYNKATQTLEVQREALLKRVRAGEQATMSYKAEQAALRGLPAQFTDIVVSLQGGQAPLTVLLQQGGQLKDMFGGIGPAARAMGGYFVGLINPVTALAAVLGTLAIAAYSGSQELTAFNKAMVQSSNASGTSASEFAVYRQALDDIVGTAGKAASALVQMEASGKVASESFVAVGEAAIKMERATGTAMDQILDDFIAIGKDPVDAAVRLDEKYRFLTTSVLAQAQALVEQGREQEAVKLLQEEMASTATETADKMIEQAGYIERAWQGVKDVVTETWDALKGIGRGETSIELIAKKEAELKTLREQQSSGVNVARMAALGIDISDGRAAALEKEITQLRQRANMESYMADEAAKSERTRKEGVDALVRSNRRYLSEMDGVAKAEHNLAEVRRDNEKLRKAAGAGGLDANTAKIIAANEAEAIKKLAEAREKANKPKRAGALDTTGVQEVKSQLAMINAEYEGHYKRITALGEANIVSEEATYYSQKAILEAQRKAVTASFDDQEAAIRKLQGNKKNSAAQNISLDNQLTKTEEQRIVALEKIYAKLDQLQAKENGRIQERAKNIAAYKAALDSQLESLVEEGARNADGVGRGSRQANLDRQIGQLDRRFNRQQLELANSRSEMDPEEYSAKLRALQENHTAMTKQILENDRQIQQANADWTNGFTSAVENAIDIGMDFAGTWENMVTGAFNRSGDALAQFVTTGKINFKDFAYSVMADMAAMAAKQAAMGALGALFKLGATAASAYFGGGATSAGSTQAGYSPDVINAWAAGQAQGGVWSGGTQYFANGGAFTNSVVSTPTAFGMSNNRRGVMGEAGPEAIVPLARTRNGDLGVRMLGDHGMGSGGGTMVVVNVNVTESGTTSQTTGGPAYQQFGNELGQFVDSRIRTVINSETRPGGSLQPQGT